jgi:alcohol dehydrogenase class IV
MLGGYLVVLKFFMPTKVFLGKDCIIDNAVQMKALGKKAFIVTGKSSAKNGALACVQTALQTSGIAYNVFDRILSNPSIELVREAAKIAREEGADFIIGIGGGSPMDAAKAIAVLAVNEIDDTTLFSGPYPHPVLPVVAVPTTAGTGSEVTQYSILTDDQQETKSSIANEVIFPKIAFLDASYTQNLPSHVTINTAVDALSHAVEGYLSAKATSTSSMLAAESMTILGQCLKVLDGKVDFEVREQLLYASMLAGMVIAHTGTTALHSMGYSLTYFRDIDHGRANGLLMYEYLEFIAAQHGSMIDKMVSLLNMKSLGELKTCLDKLFKDKESITQSEIQQFSAKAIQAKNILNTIRPPSQEDLAGIMERSFCR